MGDEASDFKTRGADVAVSHVTGPRHINSLWLKPLADSFVGQVVSGPFQLNREHP